MSDRTDRPPVPEPRDRDDDGPWFPLVPAPRAAPKIERASGARSASAPRRRSPEIADREARSAERPGPAVPASTALALRPSRSHTLCEWAGDLVRGLAQAVGIAVEGLRTAVERLVAMCPRPVP